MSQTKLKLMWLGWTILNRRTQPKLTTQEFNFDHLHDQHLDFWEMVIFSLDQWNSELQYLKNKKNKRGYVMVVVVYRKQSLWKN